MPVPVSVPPFEALYLETSLALDALPCLVLLARLVGEYFAEHPETGENDWQWDVQLARSATDFTCTAVARLPDGSDRLMWTTRLDGDTATTLYRPPAFLVI
jgi:hypothetical protein